MPLEEDIAFQSQGVCAVNFKIASKTLSLRENKIVLHVVHGILKHFPFVGKTAFCHPYERRLPISLISCQIEF